MNRSGIQNHKSMLGWRRDRSGFTLIEVLLVTILSAVLMVGLWSLFGTYIRLFESGPQRIEKAQLLRALKQQLTDDLHAAIQIPPAHQNRPDIMTFGSTTSSSLSNESEEIAEETPSFSEQPSAKSTLPRFGLVGSRQSLKLYVLQTVPGIEGISPTTTGSTEMLENSVPSAPELRTILYTFSEPHVMRLGDRESPPGLIRRELDWQTAIAERELSAASGDTLEQPILTNISPEELAADNSIAWIPEVVNIQFRYYGNGQWFDDWDSLQRESLPAAVEVIMVFGTQPEAETDMSDLKSITETTGKESVEPELDTEIESDLESTLSSQQRKSQYRFLVHLPNALDDGRASSPIGGVAP